MKCASPWCAVAPAVVVAPDPDGVDGGGVGGVGGGFTCALGSGGGSSRPTRREARGRSRSATADADCEHRNCRRRKRTNGARDRGRAAQCFSSVGHCACRLTAAAAVSSSHRPRPARLRLPRGPCDPFFQLLERAKKRAIRKPVRAFQWRLEGGFGAGGTLPARGRPGRQRRAARGRRRQRWSQCIGAAQNPPQVA